MYQSKIDIQSTMSNEYMSRLSEQQQVKGKIPYNLKDKNGMKSYLVQRIPPAMARTGYKSASRLESTFQSIPNHNMN